MGGLVIALATVFFVAGFEIGGAEPILEDTFKDVMDFQKSVLLFLQDWLDNSYTDANLTEAQQDYYDSFIQDDDSEDNYKLSQELEMFYHKIPDDSVMDSILKSFRIVDDDLDEYVDEVLNDEDTDGNVLSRRKRSLLPDVRGLPLKEKKRIRSEARQQIKAQGRKAWRDFLKQQRQNRKDRGIFRGVLTAEKRREKYLRKKGNRPTEATAGPPSGGPPVGNPPPPPDDIAAPPPAPGGAPSTPKQQTSTPSEHIPTANPNDEDKFIGTPGPAPPPPNVNQPPPPIGPIGAPPPPPGDNNAPPIPNKEPVTPSEHIPTPKPEDEDKFIDNINNNPAAPPPESPGNQPPPVENIAGPPPPPPGANDVNGDNDSGPPLPPPIPAQPQGPEFHEAIPVPDPDKIDEVIDNINGRRKKRDVSEQRKEYHELTAEEKDSLKVTLTLMKATIPDHKEKSLSNYDVFVKQHRMLENPQAYSNKESLIWHRDFLRRFEAAMKEFDNTFKLPYLDLCKLMDNTDIENASIWQEFLFNPKVIDDCSWIGPSLKRSIVTSDIILKRLNRILNCSGKNMKRTRFGIEEFAQIHSLFGPCVEGGSHIACPTCAVSDPVFWMIYAYLDDQII